MVQTTPLDNHSALMAHTPENGFSVHGFVGDGGGGGDQNLIERLRRVLGQAWVWGQWKYI